jgi:6-pyruvoyl-tetrahydropterin synthase
VTVKLTPPVVLTGVGWYFSASHYDEVRRETHGHSYEVVAWYPYDTPRDAVVLQTCLKVALSGFDHKTLPPELTRAEAIAQAIMGLLDGCVAVDISRPVERLYARVSR